MENVELVRVVVDIPGRCGVGDYGVLVRLDDDGNYQDNHIHLFDTDEILFLYRQFFELTDTHEAQAAYLLWQFKRDRNV